MAPTFPVFLFSLAIWREARRAEEKVVIDDISDASSRVLGRVCVVRVKAVGCCHLVRLDIFISCI